MQTDLHQIDQPSVLFLSGVRGDTRHYRTFHPYEQLKLAGIPVSLSHTTDPDLPSLITMAQMVIFHRVTWDGYIEGLIQAIEHRGGLAVLDTDDLTFDPAAFRWIDSPDFQDPIRAGLYQEDLRRNRKTLDRCGAVLTSTDYLAEQIRCLGKPAWVHRNAFSLEMLALSREALQKKNRRSDRVVIGYASGTPTHGRDFDQVRPALQKLLANCTQTQLWLIGPLDTGAGWEKFGMRVKRIPKVPWRQLPELLAQLDINLAPLAADNPFAQSKSEIKYVEAGLVGVSTVATPTGAFQYAIRSGENGILAATEAEWSAALEGLVSNSNLRTHMGQRALDDVLVRYHPGTRAGELVNTLNQLSRQLQGKPFWERPEGWQPATPGLETIRPIEVSAIEVHPTFMEMAGYSLRRRGLGTLLKQIWVFFRRAVAPVFPYQSSNR